jgi:hypothetical protein
MATPLDTLLVSEYTGGMNAPLASQAGHAARADSAGTNVEYVGPQVLAGTGTWDGKSDPILVRGSGVRTITIPNGYYLGQRVTIVDADGTSNSGTIALSAAGVLHGDVTLSTQWQSHTICYVAEGVWSTISGAA